MDEYVTRTLRRIGPWHRVTIRWPKTTDNWLKREARRAGVTPSAFLRRTWMNHGVLSVPGEVGQTVTVRFAH